MRLKEVIKDTVNPDTKLYKSLVSIYQLSKYRFWRPRTLRSMSVSDILDKYSKIKGQVRFVQIGSNDGIGGDPLRSFIVRDHWQGVLVEPLPATFQQLQKNYLDYERNTDLIFENVAISDKNEVKIFYYIDAKKANLPESTTNKFSSFHKDVPLKYKNAYPGFENSICELEIEALTLNTLLERHNLKQEINLLHVDTEGHDYQILKQIDFNTTRPDIILFERWHLKLDDYKKCVKEFEKHDYVLYEQNMDAIAIQSVYKDKIIGGSD